MGRNLYTKLQERQTFKKENLTITLADGHTTSSKLLSTTVPIVIEKRTIPIDIIVLPDTGGNCTLLGANFLVKSNIVLDVGSQTWYFRNTPDAYANKLLL